LRNEVGRDGVDAIAKVCVPGPTTIANVLVVVFRLEAVAVVQFGSHIERRGSINQLAIPL
jgi:hypothetical protein